MSEKPIRVFYNDITGTFWATQHWKETVRPDGKTTDIRITGKKFNVTQDVANAIVSHNLEFIPVTDEEPKL